MAVFGQLSSIRPELTGIALEESLVEEDLSFLTDSLSALQLLMCMQRRLAGEISRCCSTVTVCDSYFYTR